MPEELQNWDQRWNEPDPRITTLKSNLEIVTDDMSVLKNNIGAIIMPALNTHTEDIASLKLITQLNYLVNIKSITSEELHNIHQMLISPDPDNHFMALTAIDQKLQEIKYHSMVTVLPK